MINRALTTALLLGPLIAIEAYCEVYMTDEKAAAKIFPGVQLTKSILPLSKAEQEKIKEISGESPRGDSAQVWRAKSGEWVFIDQVLGKHEFITFAVGIKDGKVQGIEILEYRESYGQKVRDDWWRAQFAGKDIHSPLKLNTDIKNISGATLSSAHITAGVRRVIETYELLKARS
jgi:uncharacterized protein with FMN-binding domain